MRIIHLLYLSVVFVIIVALHSGDVFAQSRATSPPEKDTQNWNDVQVAVPVNEKLDLVFYGTLRIGRNIHRPVDERAGVGISIKAGKYLTFAPFYTYIATQPYEGRKGYENRLSFPATLRFTAGKWTISDRNLIQRRLLSSRSDVTQYRNRLQVDHPVGPKKLALKVFVTDEVFYDWSVDDWVRNRFAVGVSKVFNKNFTGDLYYMRQNDGRSRPGDLHVIGTTFRFRL